MTGPAAPALTQQTLPRRELGIALGVTPSFVFVGLAAGLGTFYAKYSF
jgi:hypothetical protein